MLNQTKSKNPRHSKFLGNRRKRFLSDSKRGIIVLPDKPQISLKNKKADIYCRMFKEGFFRVKYYNKENGRSAFGYGHTLSIAFENMNRNFNDKYNSHEC